MIAIIDIGVGNMGAIKNMLRKVKADAVVTRDVGVLAEADKIVLPGVGAFDEGMRRLTESGLMDTLNRRVLKDRVPVLGICLGAQMLGRSSEEGTLPGLGWIAMDAVRFPADLGLRVPHMGWNQVQPRNDPGLFTDITADMRFYFAHSYYLRCDNSGTIAGAAKHGVDIAAAVAQDTIWGVQFHPEKSHRFGAAVLKNFAEHAGSRPQQ